MVNFIHKNEQQNPYTIGAEGRREWNDRYMNMAKAIRNWQLAFFSLIIINLIMALAIAKIATESKIKPYVVETNQGMPYALKPVKSLSTRDQILINYAINQFILNAKTVINDASAEKELLNKVYAYATGNTIKFLRDFYKKNNPFDLADHYTINVNILNAVPLSNNTWLVMWEETKHNTLNGNVLNNTRWVGHITYAFGEANAKYLNDNPFGIYITNLAWSENHT